MYAVIETGGKQYRVEVGTELEVELLDAEAGQSITLDRVLLIADGADAAIGNPIVSDAAVEAEVVGRERGDKVIAFKYQPKARRRVKKGHRQELTLLRVADIRYQGRRAAGDVTAAGSAKGADRKRLEEAAARQAAEDAALAAKLNLGAEAEAPAPAEEAVEAADKPATATKTTRRKAKPASRTRSTAGKAPAAKADAGTGAAAGEATTKGFEIYKDKAGEWRWRLRAANDELVAVSEEGFASKSSVSRALGVVRKNVAAAEDHLELTADDEAEGSTAKGFEIYEDKAGKWRWRLRAANGELLAIPEQGFASKAGVIKALDVVRRNVAAAEGYHEVGEDTETPKAAPRRTRTKKDG